MRADELSAWFGLSKSTGGNKSSQIKKNLKIGLLDPGQGTPTPFSAIQRLTPASDGNFYHIVKSGENLVWIADQFDITLAELLAWKS